MANVIKLVQGDTRPALVVALKDQTTNLPLDLTGASVVLKFREVGAIELTAEVPGTLVDPIVGVCVFSWDDAPGSLAGNPGLYEGEIEIIFADTTVQTVYDILRFALREQF